MCWPLLYLENVSWCVLLRMRSVCGSFQMVNLFVILLVSFFVLMSPFRLLTLFRSITECSLGQRVEGWERLILDISLPLSSVVFAANSIVNPILFNMLSSRFRFTSLLKQLKRAKRELLTNNGFSNSKH